MLTRAVTLINTKYKIKTEKELIMSKEFSTVINKGKKSPFILIMQLNKKERNAFIEQVTTNMYSNLKQPVMGK